MTLSEILYVTSKLDIDGGPLSSKDRFVTFELEFHGRQPELDGFSKEFDDLQWVSKHLNILGPKGAAYLGGAPAELILFVLSITANILAISKILAERVASGGDSIIRVGDKEIILKGKWKPQEIANVITLISKQTSKEEALRNIAKVKSAKIRETRKELETIEDTIPQYEKLVKTFNELPKKGKPQKRKLKEYQMRLSELQQKAENLRSFIDFLRQKI